jgi:hypothetical protein
LTRKKSKKKNLGSNVKNFFAKGHSFFSVNFSFVRKRKYPIYTQHGIKLLGKTVNTNDKGPNTVRAQEKPARGANQSDTCTSQMIR